MAVHMIQRQEQMPWQAQLASQILVPMISGAIERQRQRDENRKQNAYVGELASQIAAMTGANQGGLMNGQPVPEGYNADPWAQAYHKTNSPLTQFDMGTADLMPFAAPKQQSTPSVADMLNTVAGIRSNPRFSHLSPDVINSLSAPYLQAMEEQRMRDMRNRYVSDLNNAQTWDDRFNIMTNANLEGAANPELLKTLGEYAKYRQPYYQTDETDAGDRKIKWVFNPATGEVTPKYETEVGVSPNTAATLASNEKLENRRLDITEQKYGQDYDIANRQQTEIETQGAYERENPKLEFVTDVDGNRVGINPRTGQVVQIKTPDGQNIKVTNKEDLFPFVDDNGQVVIWDRKTNQSWKPTGPNGEGLYPTPRVSSSNSQTNRNMSKSDEVEYNDLKDRAKKLREQIASNQKQLDTLYSDAPNDPSAINLRKRIEDDKKQLDDIEARQQEILDKSRGRSQSTIPSNIAWVSPDGKHGFSHEAINDLYRRADAGEFKSEGINSSADIRADLQRNGWSENTAAATPTTPNTPLMPPLSSDMTSSPDVPASVSTDIHNHSTPAEQKEQIDILNGDKVTSSDIRDPVSGDVKMPKPTSQDRTMATPAPRRDGDVIDLGELPDAVYYDPERDKNIPKGKIMTEAAFKEWLARKLSNPNLAHLTPEQIIQQFINQGLKVRRATPTSFYSNPTAPEEVGMSINGIDLPGLARLGTSSTNQTAQYASNAPRVTQASLPNEYEMPEWDLSDAELLAGRSGGVRRGARLVRRRPVARRAVRRTAAPAPRGGYTNYEQQRTHVDGAAKRHGVDSALVRAIIETESSWKPNARSKVGAMGLMQLMPKTAKWLGVRNAYDPAQNIEGGSKYIAQLIRQFGGNVSKALMAYNCGAGNVKKGRIPAESRRYAQKVLGIYRRLKGQA